MLLVTKSPSCFVMQFIMTFFVGPGTIFADVKYVRYQFATYICKTVTSYDIYKKACIGTYLLNTIL